MCGSMKEKCENMKVWKKIMYESMKSLKKYESVKESMKEIMKKSVKDSLKVWNKYEKVWVWKNCESVRESTDKSVKKTANFYLYRTRASLVGPCSTIPSRGYINSETDVDSRKYLRLTFVN